MVGFLCPLAATVAIADPCTRACVDIEASFPAGTFMPWQVVELDVMRMRASQKSRVIGAISGEVESGCQAVKPSGYGMCPTCSCGRDDSPCASCKAASRDR
jgi:hypothetical protein